MANAQPAVSEENHSHGNLSHLHDCRAQVTGLLDAVANTNGTHPAVLEKLRSIRSGIQHRINAVNGQVH